MGLASTASFDNRLARDDDTDTSDELPIFDPIPLASPSWLLASESFFWRCCFFLKTEMEKFNVVVIVDIMEGRHQ